MLERTGTNDVLPFLTATNRSYAVQFTTLLPANNWITLIPNIAGNGGFTSVTNNGSKATTSRFYRVQLQ